MSLKYRAQLDPIGDRGRPRTRRALKRGLRRWERRQASTRRVYRGTSS